MLLWVAGGAMRHILGRTLWVVTFLAIVAVGAAFAWLAVGVADDKAGGWVAVTVTLMVGVGAAIAQYMLAPKSGGSMRRPFWTTWKGLATLFLACVAGASAMSLLLPLLDPPPATEKTVTDDGEKTRSELIEAKDEILAALSPSQRAIIEVIPGLWGEAGCRVVYRFRIEQDAVLIDLVRKEPGMAGYSMGASLIPGGVGERLYAVVERSTEPDESKDSLEFTYRATGASERLIWLNRDQDDVAGLELDRCDA